MSSDFKIGSEEWRENVASPLLNTDGWQKFVLSLLKDDELIEGFPSAPGLARVANLLYKRVEINSSVIKAPTSHDRSATSQATVNVFSSLGDAPHYLKYTASADVSESNTKSPYNKHPVATAETKAIGRALKLLLGLKIHTFEEMLEDENDYKKINAMQIKTVNLLCDRLEVSKKKFLAAHAGVDVSDFEVGSTTLTEADGTRLLELLNEYQTKGVPDEFVYVDPTV